MKRYMKKALLIGAAGILLTGCAKTGSSSAAVSAQPAETEETVPETIDYLLLVNKTNRLPETWEEELDIVKSQNSLGDEVETERTAYEAYLKLKEELEANDIHVDLDSAYRSVAHQQEIWDRFTEKYGEEYTISHVAVPGYSEHQTGLALDLYLIIDGKDVYENEDMVQYPEIWEKIHARLANYGFILRYQEGKEDITGYSYEPWHIRYVGPEAAKEITEQGVTLEEYLGAVSSSDTEIDYGTSEIYTKPEMDEAISLVRQQFAVWPQCEIYNIRYASDDCNSEENVKWMNELVEGKEFTECIEFLTDFRTPAENSGSLEPDTEYKDYQWWLARPEGGSWELVSFGY